MNDFEDRPRPWRSSRYDRDDRGRDHDERDDYDDQPGHPRYGRDPRDLVQGPGWGLAIAGWSCAALTFLVLAVLGLVGAQNPRIPAREYYILATVYGGFGLVGIVMFVVIAVGGQNMRQFRRYGLCMTAAVLAIATIAVLGICGFVIAPVGIWALVVLSKTEVKRQFDLVRRTAAGRVTDDYDDQGGRR